jgi:hypothetical protein
VSVSSAASIILTVHVSTGRLACATTLRPVAFVSGYRRAATRFSGKFTSEDTLAADSRNRGRDFADDR